MFSALVQCFLFPQHSGKTGKLQHMCNRPVSLYNMQACVISALRRSPWGSTQNHTLFALLHNNSVSFLDLSLFSHHSPSLKPTMLNLCAHSYPSHFSFLITQSHWQSHFLVLTGRIFPNKQWLSGITGKCIMLSNKQGSFSFKLCQFTQFSFSLYFNV